MINLIQEESSEEEKVNNKNTESLAVDVQPKVISEAPETRSERFAKRKASYSSLSSESARSERKKRRKDTKKKSHRKRSYSSDSSSSYDRRKRKSSKKYRR